MESLQGMPGTCRVNAGLCCSLERWHGLGSQMAQHMAVMPDPVADMTEVHRMTQEAQECCRPQPRLWQLLTTPGQHQHLSPTMLLKQVRAQKSGCHSILRSLLRRCVGDVLGYGRHASMNSA